MPFLDVKGLLQLYSALKIIRLNERFCFFVIVVFTGNLMMKTRVTF